MKSKLTLRLDEGLKERAKRLAEERRTSVSKIIEDYFRLLLRGSSNGPVGGSEGDISYEDVSYEDVSGEDIGEWSKPGTMDVPSLSKSIGTTYAQNTSAVPTEVQRKDRRACPKRANPKRTGRGVRADPDDNLGLAEAS